MSTSICAQTKVSGDFRYRLDQESERIRHRIRGRLSATGEIKNNISYGARLISGSDNPLSGNQTIGSGFSSKPIMIDHLFTDINLNKNTIITLGKYKNRFLKSGNTELIWDEDLSLEGIHIEYSKGLFYLNLGHNWVEERAESKDTIIQSAQIGFNYTFPGTKIDFGLSYFDYQGVQNQSTLYDSSESFGNSINSSNNYINDYDLIEAKLKMKFTLIPLVFTANYVTNEKIKSNNQAWLSSIHYHLKSNIEVAFNYRIVEIDSIIGAFSDSDFNGGITGGKGYELGLKYKFTSSYLALAYFRNQDINNSENKYSRLFIDFGMNL
jgi:hypothetical protein